MVPVLAVFCVAGAGCGRTAPFSPVDDAGVLLDQGRDGGLRPRRDAGTPDAGVAHPDAGLHDAGGLDAGGLDAGPEHDAGLQIDAGLPIDGGVPDDAGFPDDAGTELDAGAEMDAGTQQDAGPPDSGVPFFWSDEFLVSPHTDYVVDGTCHLYDPNLGVMYVTQSVTNCRGRVFLDQRLELNRFEVRARIGMGPGGADGMAIAFVDDPTYFGYGQICVNPFYCGRHLDLEGMTGFAVEFDTWNNFWDPTSSQHVAVVENGASTHLAFTPVSNLASGSWRDVVIRFDQGELEVWMNDVKILTLAAGTLPARFEGFIGFTAATGGAFTAHKIDYWEVEELP